MIFNVNSGAGKIPINVVPSTNSSFTYDGDVKSPEWQNYDAEQLTISGSDSATNAGTYTVCFTPKADYEWWDGTSTPKEVTWSIAKAAGTLSLSESSGTITGKKGTAKTFTVTRAGDGEISVSSSSTSVATVSISGTTVTVTPKGYGTATITVSVAEGTNYTAPDNKTYSIKVDYLYIAPNTSISWTKSGASVSQSSSGTNFSASVNNKGTKYAQYTVNVTNYTKFTASGTSSGSSSGSGRVTVIFGLYKNGSLVSGYSGSLKNESGTVNISTDLSSMSGEYQVRFTATSQTESTTSYTGKVNLTSAKFE